MPSIRILSIVQPEEPPEQSVPSLNRKSIFCPAKGWIFAITWVDVLVPTHALCPSLKGGVMPLQVWPVRVIVPLYPPDCMYGPPSNHVAPLSVENSSTPPSLYVPPS